MVFAVSAPLGSTTTVTGASPAWAAANASRFSRSSPDWNQSSGPPGCPATRIRTGSRGGCRDAVRRRGVDVGVARRKSRDGPGDLRGLHRALADRQLARPPVHHRGVLRRGADPPRRVAEGVDLTGVGPGQSPDSGVLVEVRVDLRSRGHQEDHATDQAQHLPARRCADEAAGGEHDRADRDGDPGHHTPGQVLGGQLEQVGHQPVQPDSDQHDRERGQADGHHPRAGHPSREEQDECDSAGHEQDRRNDPVGQRQVIHRGSPAGTRRRRVDDPRRVE